ncbi:MAG: fumarylacetoacetase [Acidimicrobiales bacterium]
MGLLDLESNSQFGLQNLPYGVLSAPGRPPFLAVRIGDQALDLTGVSAEVRSEMQGLLAGPTLNGVLAAGPVVWRRLREQVQDWLSDRRYELAARRHLLNLDEMSPRLPIALADYVDFYSSEHHATNVGRLFRPDADPLPASWRAIPMGYHGRAGTVVVSGTPVVRPRGQVRLSSQSAPVVAPCRKLDFEAEVGFVVGVPSELGSSVSMEQFEDHVFGVCLVNDWSARDIQSFEYVPLGPFLGKSFATSISGWIVPLDALAASRVPPPTRDPAPLPYLSSESDHGFEIDLEVSLNASVISRPPFSSMYWTAAQQLAHMTVNGASLRTGDLFASGTVSGPEPSQVGSLLELSRNGTAPFDLGDGRSRTFLEDGDSVVIRGVAPGREGSPIGLSEVSGSILPARSQG